jgi:hypothetical protein
MKSRVSTYKQKKPFRYRKGFSNCLTSLCYLSLVDSDSPLVLRAFELHLTVDECEDGEVSTDSHARTWVELGAALSDDDCAWLDDFSAVLLNAASLTVTVATVSS